MVIIGIDPGKSGAIAVVDIRQSGTLFPLRVEDCPTVKVASKGKSQKTAVDPIGMALTLKGFVKDSGGCHVFIEKVGAMPGQGVTSMFSFGHGYGVWIGIIVALGIPMTFVTPQKWKKVMLSGMPKGKDASRIRTMQLRPEQAELFKRKKDDGRAEAFLIAEYGRRELGL